MSKSDDGSLTPATDSPRRTRIFGKAPRTRNVLLASVVLAVGITSIGVAATGDQLREGVRNGTTTSETEIVSNLGASTGPKGGYSTRQSNLSNSGGGAIYGCRSTVGGSAANPPKNPCVRANNLSTGYAFEFNASNGPIVGAISAGAGGDTKKPFVTNATGVATGLNADRVDGADLPQILAAARATQGLDADKVDGKDASELQALFAQVDADGAAGATRGVPTDGVTNPAGDGTYSVVFTGDRSACSFSTAIAGADFGHIKVTPSVADGNTTVAVDTAAADGTPAGRAFHLTVNC